MMTSSNEAFSALLALCMRVMHRSPVNFPHKGQWGGVLIFASIYACTKRSVNNRDAAGLRRHRAHYDVIVMKQYVFPTTFLK